jgi:ethanolamine utilization protein EutA
MSRPLSLISDELFSANKRVIGDATEVSLTSVGIDVGSSTSQLVISDLQLVLVDGVYRTRTATIRHISDIMLTPYGGVGRIDAPALRRWAAEQYRLAGIQKSDIDAGAVLLTGNALTKANARRIAGELSVACGELVAASAGPDLEAILAARGSGAVGLAISEGLRLLHVDIGGGTTKFAVCDAGVIEATAAIDVGARIMAIGADGRVSRLEPSAKRIARWLGATVRVGEPADDQRAAMAAFVAARILEFAHTGALDEPFQSLLLTDPIGPAVAGVDAVTVSGGVSEFVFAREGRDFGDLGGSVGAAIRQHFEHTSSIPLRHVRAGIRATVLGASRHTVQLSGQTIFVHPPGILPIRNVSVSPLPRSLFGSDLSADSVRESVVREVRKRDTGLGSDASIALVIPWAGSATFERLDALSSGIIAGSKEAELHQPIIVISTGDMGGLLGVHLTAERGAREVVSLDGLDIGEFDFLDIGAVLDHTGAVPVVIKSLHFPTEQAAKTLAPD